nr:HAD-IA family hydrolase [Streptomyces sp. SID1328]
MGPCAWRSPPRWPWRCRIPGAQHPVSAPPSLAFTGSLEFSCRTGNARWVGVVEVRACRRLGVAPGEAVVFEDSAAGLQAGRRAGARCIAVGQAARTPALCRLADHAVEDLTRAPVIGPADTVVSRRRAGTRAAG